MVFNLVPIPPLDGSKILAAFLPARLRERYLSLDRFGFILVIILVMLAGGLITPIVDFLSRAIIGGA
jgi:Zn-dependent protease